MAKKRRVPLVLWRLFRERARTLAHTIVSLIPSSPEATQCRCKGRRCLGCSGKAAMSFLLRSDDPSDYRMLLTKCFVVVSRNAPSIDAFYPDRRWSQIQIVRRTIEMLLCEQPSTNVLSSGYDKFNQSSPTVELLTSSSWDLLLKRIGDGLMVYLLKHTSIFLPLPLKRHHQVAGPPINNLCYKSTKPMSESGYQDPSPFQHGSRKKRKTIDRVSSLSEREQVCSSFGCAGSSSFLGCVGCKVSSCIRSFGRDSKERRTHRSLAEVVIPSTGNANKDSVEELQQSSNQNIAKPKKRVRQFSWQRRRKRRNITCQETSLLNPCTRISTDEEISFDRLQCGPSTCLNDYHDKIPIPHQCSCCLGLETPRKVTVQAEISKQAMFYQTECFSSVFPRDHILNSLKPKFSDANLLIRDIFGISSHLMSCSHSSDSCLVGSACLYHSLVKTLKVLIRKAQCCQYSRLLEKHCAVPSLEQNANTYVCSIHGKECARLHQEGNSQMKNDRGCDCETQCRKIMEPILLEPNKSHCSKSQVVSFIWAVCRSVVPPDLLGTTSDWRILRRNISKFIRLRRFEKFSLRQCMHKLKTSRFPLLSNKNSTCYLSNLNGTGCSVDLLKQHKRPDEASSIMKHRYLESWIFWFFSCLVVPLVKANFYVTETEHGKQDVFYYRKSVWQELTKRTITRLKDRRYLHLDNASVRNILSNRSFGFSKIRLRPKENGVRVLANLKASSRMPMQEPLLKCHSRIVQRNPQLQSKRVKSDYFKPVNSVLHDLHAVLKGLRIKEADKLGASVFDYNDVYRRLCPFILGLKNGSTVMPCVFIVGSDVVKAFDSVDQDKLLSVMKNLFLQDEYLLKQNNQVVCTKKSMRVHENLTLKDCSINSGCTQSKSPVPFRSLHSVVVNQESSRKLWKKDLFSNLTEHVKRNVLQFDRKFYLQEVGIPQGSVLSSLLSSFYYGHLERNVIYPFLEKACEPNSENLSGASNCNDISSTQSKGEVDTFSSPKYLLLRFIDDFLFISTSKMQAANFFTRLQRGFREYNCYMNTDKSCLNFDSDLISGIQSNRLYVGEDGISFLRWSGLLINCRSLEVQADYTRYLNNHLSSTLTVCWKDKPGCRLKDKLGDFMRPKCHPIFYDLNINSAAVVRLNIYQSFLICAMKFHCYVRDLSYVCKLQMGAYWAMIERSFRYMYGIIKRRMQHPMYLGSGLRTVLQLEKGEIEWLGLNAYSRVLKRKQSRHKELLSLLRSKLLAHTTGQHLSSELNYAVDDSHSSLLWKIKY